MPPQAEGSAGQTHVCLDIATQAVAHDPQRLREAICVEPVTPWLQNGTVLIPVSPHIRVAKRTATHGNMHSH